MLAGAALLVGAGGLLTLICFVRAQRTTVRPPALLWQAVLLRMRDDTALLLHARSRRALDPLAFRDCPECEEPQPPRASHCPQCDACSFRFELHSKVLARCVSMETWKYYYLMHVYGCPVWEEASQAEDQ